MAFLVRPLLICLVAGTSSIVAYPGGSSGESSDGEKPNANWKCCLACQDAPQAIHPEPTVYPPECFTKCTYTVTKYTAAISKKCKCGPGQDGMGDGKGSSGEEDKNSSGEAADAKPGAGSASSKEPAKDASGEAPGDASSPGKGSEAAAPSSPAAAKEGADATGPGLSDMAGPGDQAAGPPPGATSGEVPAPGRPAADQVNAAGGTSNPTRGRRSHQDSERVAVSSTRSAAAEASDRAESQTTESSQPEDPLMDDQPLPEYNPGAYPQSYQDYNVKDGEDDVEASEGSSAAGKTRRKRQTMFRGIRHSPYDPDDSSFLSEVSYAPGALGARLRRGSKDKEMMGCPDNPFKICKAKPMPPPEECPEDPEKVPNRHIGPCCRLGPGYLSAYGVNAKTDFRIIYRAKNLTYEVIFPSEIVDWENIDFDKYEKKRVTQIVRQRGGMEAIRKTTTFNTCNCEELAAGGSSPVGSLPVLQDPSGSASGGPPGMNQGSSSLKEKRQLYF